MTSDYSEFKAHIGPRAAPTQENMNPRFVVLLHNHPEDHWDWMFEKDGALLTFRSIPRPFSRESPGPTEMTFIAPHRLDYLLYEGPVSGNRGTVQRVDTGFFRWVVKDVNRWVLELAGAALRGELSLQLITNQVESPIWEATFKPTS